MNRATWGAESESRSVTEWGPVNGSRTATCWSCRTRSVATLQADVYRPWLGFRNRTTRHPGLDLPWYGPSPKAVARARGRHPGLSGGFVFATPAMHPPVVVTCSCGADNLVDMPAPSE
jgi:hypothetical protein